MPNKLVFACLASAVATMALAQEKVVQDPQLAQEIVQSGFIHRPLPIDDSRSYEVLGLQKEVLAEETLPNADQWNQWTATGYGKLGTSAQKTANGKTGILFQLPTSTGKRATGSASDPDYAVYGHAGAEFPLNGQNWEGYNRIAFDIFPNAEGARVVNVDLVLQNGADKLKKGFNRQNGDHLVQLKNQQWNHCFLDMGEYQRDQMDHLAFKVSLKGKGLTTGDSISYHIANIRLQQIRDPEKVSGWQPGDHRVVYSTSGYSLEGSKTAIANTDIQAKTFEILDAQGNNVYTGNAKTIKTTTGTYTVLDFSSVHTEGSYRLRYGNQTTPAFEISKTIWDNSLWKTTNFVFGQRCGYAVPGKHGTCHVDLFSQHNGERIAFSGGWHDAGDLSQQTLQTGDVAYNFLEAYTKLKDTDPTLAQRLLEEGEWGLDFILKNRYGDGYRASSMGLLIWQDGIVDSFDDITSVRVQNMAFDNFLYAAYEAYAAMTIPNDPGLTDYLQRVAKQDFDFAVKRDEKVGFGEFLTFYEHSYNTSKSQYMATASWAASMLYQLTQDSYYAQKAAEYIQYTLACQRTEPVGKSDIKGFFYRDTSKKVVVHYNHQSREQLYMEALALLCKTQPNHPDHQKWQNAIALYGGYLKSLMPYTAPYGMLASGVYGVDENQDEESFSHLHLFPPADAKERYTVQIKNGVKLDQDHYLKRFPVWFSIFNGNTAVNLSMGKAAVICGKFLNDPELLQIGREQLYWTVGKNPFGQSLIYGEGQRYPQLDNFSSGLSMGEIPVGIRTLGDTDEPYWPQTDTSCYKEVWVTSAGKWISLATEF